MTEKDIEGDAREIVRHIRTSHATNMMNAAAQDRSGMLFLLKLEEAIAASLNEIEKRRSGYGEGDQSD